MAYEVKRMFHPTHRVPDLITAEYFFKRVFGRPSLMMFDLVPRRLPEGFNEEAMRRYPRDYSTFTVIQDVLFDTLDPKRYVVNGKQLYATVEKPYLRSFGFYVDGMVDVYLALREAGIRCFGQDDKIAEGDEPPMSAAGNRPLYWTVPEDAGLSYEIFSADWPFPGDQRLDPGWEVPPVSVDDPLGIERCSHHTVLTSNPGRAHKFLVDVLGGTVVAETYNHELGGSATFIDLAHSTLEYVVPAKDSPLAKEVQDALPGDKYRTLSWKVKDLDQVASHLKTEGVGIASRTDEVLVADAETALGIPWRFNLGGAEAEYR